MQALSQLSYGPTMLRAGNHSDIDGAWEVVCAKKFARRIRQWRDQFGACLCERLMSAHVAN
ncbi:hypothetical protein XacyCFBP1159_13475 [Xanthomonas arboricola pv. corylina]|nr:hypothetical protein XacyCFBP2565_17340 [Xanthomonas arboricola pv. corylina]PPU60062.1 hypothetical protein XacyCFBP1159_13475 [Xanthomonas arboricola pv. corylina]